jgi:hypothetical protein
VVRSKNSALKTKNREMRNKKGGGSQGIMNIEVEFRNSG